MVDDHKNQNGKKRKSENSVKNEVHVIKKFLDTGIDAHDLHIKRFCLTFGGDVPVWLDSQTLELKLFVNGLVERQFILEFFLAWLKGRIIWINFILFAFFIELNFDAFLLTGIELPAIDEVLLFCEIIDGVHEFDLDILLGLHELGIGDDWGLVLLGLVGSCRVNETVSFVEEFGEGFWRFAGLGVEKGLIDIVSVF